MNTKLEILLFIICNIHGIYCIQIEFEFDEMIVIFWVFASFSFLLCSHVLEEYTASIVRGIEPVRVDLPWGWSRYVPLKCQNKSKHYMLRKSNRWPSFDQQWQKNLKAYRFQVKCPHSTHRKPKYSLQRLPCIVANLIFMFCK